MAQTEHKVTRSDVGAPILHRPANESVDLTPERGRVPALGDTPRKVGSTNHAHVDDSARVDYPGEGDKIVPGYVSELDKPPSVVPTAGEQRAAGYKIDPDTPDDEVPTAFTADSPTKPDELHLVDGGAGTTPADPTPSTVPEPPKAKAPEDDKHEKAIGHAPQNKAVAPPVK